MVRPRLYAILVACSVGSVVFAADKEEKYPDGTIKAKYAVDDEGRKDGAYAEFHENGKPKVKAVYSKGDLSGAYQSFYDSGKNHITATYKKGKLAGTYTERADDGKVKLSAAYLDGKLNGWRSEYEKGAVVGSQYHKDDEVLLPRGAEQIRRKLAEIYQVKTKVADRERDGALRHLKAYRYLMYLPYEAMELDDDMNKHAQAAALICEKIGRLDHRPANPGMPEDQYKIAFEGASHSNLAQGLTDYPRSIDMWMDDSDSSNVDRLGHRRWCLNPPMQKAGFGKSGKFSAMWAHDSTLKEVPDYDFVSFPARGLMPVSHFNVKYAWSVSLNPKKFKLGDNVKVKVHALDRQYNKAGRPLELTYFHIDKAGFGIPNCIIFKPRIADFNVASRFHVEVEGIEKDKEATTLGFVVEFTALK